jgi:hypothetical protein
LIVQQFSVHAIQASLYQHPALIHFIQLIFEVKMAAKFPAAVTEELKSGGWSFEGKEGAFHICQDEKWNCPTY